ncbi:hypothetical protein CRYUN_Cryun19dG0129000 [Craigia yunnanensis]
MVDWTLKRGKCEGKDVVANVSNLELCSFHGFKKNEHDGDLNAAANAHFSERDRNITRPTSTVVPVDDAMDIDDPIEVVPNSPVPPLLPAHRTMNPFSFLDRDFRRSFFDGASDFTTREPLVTHPREVREIPIEVKDSNEPSGRSGHVPAIKDVSETAQARGPNTHETVIIDEVNEDSTVQPRRQNDNSHHRHVTPNAPTFDNFPDYGNDIEEEMIRAAIEASKRDAEVSFNKKTAEQEKVLCEQGWSAGTSEAEGSKPSEVHLGNMAASNGRLVEGSPSIPEEAEDMDEQPLVRQRSRQTSSGSGESSKEVGVVESSPPSSPGLQGKGNLPSNNGNAFPSFHNFRRCQMRT